MMNCGMKLSTLTPFTSIISKSQNPSSLPANNHHHGHGSLSLSSPAKSSRTKGLPPLCCSNFNLPGPGGSGESDSKTVLDAFFLGKALGEALTERVESAVGELLSTVGRLQAEQQKQIQEFQEDVLERAKQAKDKAAREALEEQGKLIPNASTSTTTVSVTNGASASNVQPGNDSASAAVTASVNNNDSPTTSGDEDPTDEDSLASIQIDE